MLSERRIGTEIDAREVNQSFQDYRRETSVTLVRYVKSLEKKTREISPRRTECCDCSRDYVTAIKLRIIAVRALRDQGSRLFQVRRMHAACSQSV